MENYRIVNQIGDDVTAVFNGVFFTFPVSFMGRLSQALGKIKRNYGDIKQLVPEKLTEILEQETGQHFGTSYDHNTTLVILARVE